MQGDHRHKAAGTIRIHTGLNSRLVAVSVRTTLEKPVIYE